VTAWRIELESASWEIGQQPPPNNISLHPSFAGGPGLFLSRSDINRLTSLPGFATRHSFPPSAPDSVCQQSLAMDFSNLQEKVSNLTLYDLKAGVRKVQNGQSTQHQ
jgi:hypothetical protein